MRNPSQPFAVHSLPRRALRRRPLLWRLGAISASGLVLGVAVSVWVPNGAQARPAETAASNCAVDGAGLEDAQTQVLAADDARLKATIVHDADALDALLAPGFTYVHSNGRREDRAAYIEGARAARVPFVAFDRLAASVRFLDGCTALVDGSARIAYRPDPAAPAVELRTLYLAVWTSHEGSWRLAAYASTGDAGAAPH
jgi:hypothetical protein